MTREWQSAWADRDARRRQQVEQRRAQLDERLERVRELLRAAGVEQAYLFGSMCDGRPRPDSDVDLALSGCPPEAFYRLTAQIERALDLPLDVLDLDHAPEEIASPIRQRGKKLLDDTR